MSWAEGRRRRPEPQEGPRGASKALKKSLSVLRSHWRKLIRREILLDLYLGSSLWLLRGGWGAAARARQEETGRKAIMVFQVGERWWPWTWVVVMGYERLLESI